MTAGLLLALALSAFSARPPTIPVYPVVISTDKEAYNGKDHITVTVHNRHDHSVWIKPYIPIARSEGDGTWTPVYKLRVVGECPNVPPSKLECVEVPAGGKLQLAPWDWYTGGYDQCPPRRPGHRAFKGVHRLTAQWCEGKVPAQGQDRVKLVTWE